MTSHAMIGIKCGTAGCVECAVAERLAQRDRVAVRRSLRAMAKDALRVIANMRQLCANDAIADRLLDAHETMSDVRDYFAGDEASN